MLPNLAKRTTGCLPSVNVCPDHREAVIVQTPYSRAWRKLTPQMLRHFSGIETTGGDGDGKHEQGGGHGEVGRGRAPAAGGRAQVKFQHRFQTEPIHRLMNSHSASYCSHPTPCCPSLPHLTPPPTALRAPTNPRASKKRLATAKELMFRDSQKLYALRQEEANFIAEICGAQVRAK